MRLKNSTLNLHNNERSLPQENRPSNRNSYATSIKTDCKSAGFSKKFDVSIRTIYRDVKTLKTQEFPLLGKPEMVIL
ncbi:HTH domain-containing protein [Chryseobacterium indoltheticum]|uniref:HTH domain-containing protein n=1 Tax=Chryseobacterium indoltheticum TaxID=254 RepID=UPI003F4973A7